MKLSTGILVAVLLQCGVDTGYAAVRIADDRGGLVRDYVKKFEQLRDAHEIVIIDGLCAGACTTVLGVIPRDKICLTSKARFGFRASWDFGAHGQVVPDHESTRMLYSMYPPEVRRWIAQQGGLTEHMIVLPGKQLHVLYRSCSIGALPPTAAAQK